MTIVEQGGYFTHLAGILRFLVLRSPRPLRWAGYATSRCSTGWRGSMALQRPPVRFRRLGGRLSHRGERPPPREPRVSARPTAAWRPETTSGGETYERELLVRLGRGGVRLELILARASPIRPHVPNWTVHRFGIGRGLRWYVAPSVVPARIRRVHGRGRFDLLRVHSLRYIGPAALWARRLYGLDVPIVAHHHHLDPSPLNRLIEKRVVDASDRVVVGSEFARRQLATELGAAPTTSSVVPYGVDARFAPRPARRGARARATASTGRRWSCSSAGSSRARTCRCSSTSRARGGHGAADARCSWRAAGRCWPSCERRASALGLGAGVVFTGYVPEAEKVDHFNLADVFVFPSAMEGFGLTVAEAMSSGCRWSPPTAARSPSSSATARAASLRSRRARALRGAPARAAARSGAAARARPRQPRADRTALPLGPLRGRHRGVYEDALEAWRRRPRTSAPMTAPRLAGARGRPRQPQGQVGGRAPGAAHRQAAARDPSQAPGRPAVARLVPAASRRRRLVLDVGCANGAHLVRAAARCRSIVRLRLRLPHLARRAHGPARGLANAHSSPGTSPGASRSPTRTFDAALFLDVIEHLHPAGGGAEGDPPGAADDGRLLVSGPNRDTPGGGRCGRPGSSPTRIPTTRSSTRARSFSPSWRRRASSRRAR